MYSFIYADWYHFPHLHMHVLTVANPYRLELGYSKVIQFWAVVDLCRGFGSTLTNRGYRANQVGKSREASFHYLVTTYKLL
jgi:hypothetical protein